MVAKAKLNSSYTITFNSEMIDPILLSAIIYGGLLSLLSIGLTLTYLTTKVPNFAHATFATVGIYVTLTVIRVWNSTIYMHLYLPLVIGGVIALTQYLLIFRPLIKRGATVVGLMITTLAIEFILLASLNIFAEYLAKEFKIKSTLFDLKPYDVNIAGYSGVALVVPILTIFTVVLLHLALTRTKFGVAMRAAIEDASLASSIGINVNKVYAISWFVAGALAGLAGAFIPFYGLSYPDVGIVWIVAVFAASIVGGLSSIYGAVLGGFLIGFVEVVGTYRLALLVGSWVTSYRTLVPLIAIAATLLLAPNGLVGINWRGLLKRLGSKISSLAQSLRQLRA